MTFKQAVKTMESKLPPGHAVLTESFYRLWWPNTWCFLMHETKDGIMQMYWFFIHFPTEGLVHFDIREFAKLCGVEIPDNWEDRCFDVAKVSRFLSYCARKYCGSFTCEYRYRFKALIIACGHKD